MAKLWSFTFWKLNWWQKWFRVSVSTNSTIILIPQAIYIVPTRWGILFSIMTFLMLLASINYSLSLGFYFTFLLASLEIVAMFHTWLNFAHLEIESFGAQPVFAGEHAQARFRITDKKNRSRFSIAIHFDKNSVVYADIPANESCNIVVPLSTEKRGWLSLPKLVLYTEFPLGLFHAWSLISNFQPILVYAKPCEKNKLIYSNLSSGNNKSKHSLVGDDEFIGHKSHQQGDIPSRIDWKASSRGVGMLTKQFNDIVKEELLLDWENIGALNFEARISLLTRAVMDAHTSNLTYGLKLPACSISPNKGIAHYHACLKAIALL